MCDVFTDETCITLEEGWAETELLGVIAALARGAADIASASGACADASGVPEADDSDEFIWMV